jgi:hypothetical protein
VSAFVVDLSDDVVKAANDAFANPKLAISRYVEVHLRRMFIRWGTLKSRRIGRPTLHRSGPVLHLRGGHQ